MLGRMLIAFFGVIAVLTVVGLIQTKGKLPKAERDDEENVVDLRDCFNRARYMDRDGN